MLELSQFTLKQRPKGVKTTAVFLYFESTPPNVWHKYQDKIENIGFYKHPRNRFLSNPHLPLNRAGRAQRHLLYFCILNPPPQMFSMNMRKMKNVGLNTHPRNRFLSNPHLLLNRARRAQRQLLYFCIFLIHPPQSPTQPRPVQYNTIYPFLQGSSNFFRVLQIPARFFNVQLSGQDNLTKRTWAIDAIFSTITL